MRKFTGLVVAATVLLNGCMLAPGQHMSRRSIMRGDSPEGDVVQLVPITPALVATEQSTRVKATVPPELLTAARDPYRVGAGDTLHITVWDHPELTSPAGMQQQQLANGRLVRPDGTLFYPYIGTIKAEGMTLEELRTHITSRLSAYIEKPQVDVNVVDYGSQRVTLQGAFLKTDPLSITARPLTLQQALGSANIDSTHADLSGFVLTRDGTPYRLDLDALTRDGQSVPPIHLKAGDHLFMPYNDRKEIYVVGEVVRPQAITFKTTDLSLTQAIGRAGGLDPDTSGGKAVYVIRGMPANGTPTSGGRPNTVFHLDARSPSAFAVAGQFPVRPGDVVFVGPAGVTRWNRFASQLLPFSNILNNSANTSDTMAR